MCEGEYQQLLLPVSPGCHAISLASSSTEGTSITNLFCIPSDNTRPVYQTNSLLGRIGYRSIDQSLFLAVCFDNYAVLHCSAEIVVNGPVAFLWSTVSVPQRFPADLALPGALSMQMALGGAAAVRLGAEDTRPCVDYYGGCNSWVVASSTDPLILWPPAPDTYKVSSQWKFMPPIAVLAFL